MTGLGETLQENQRLREKLAEMAAVVAALQADREAAEAARAAAVAERDTVAAERDTANAKVELLAERTRDLEALLARLDRKARGPAHERFTERQRSLFEDLDLTPPNVLLPEEPESPDVSEGAAAKPRPRSAPRRRDLANDTSLPRRAVHARMPAGATCAGCGGPLRVIGESRTHRLEWVPGHFEILDITREKCACPACPGQGVLAAEPPCALPRSLCGDGLLSRVLVDKFADHLPLNRQVDRMAREGVQLDTTTLSSWVVRAAELLEVVAEAVRTEVLAADVVQADDTGFPVQDGTDGQLRKGRLWAVTDQDQAFYVFTDTKHGAHPHAFLGDFKGHTLVVDGGSEFNAAVRDHRLDRAGCWSHARRYFHEARGEDPKACGVVLDVIRRLFLIERSFASATPTERYAGRQQESLPLVDGLFAWTLQLARTVRPTSGLGRAITYLHNQEPALRVFLDDGAVPLHNNLSELLLRRPVVGRKNWLFAGSEGGAKAAATMFTLVGSCRLQGVDPAVWLADVLGKLATWPAKRVSELTPKGWREARHTG